MDYLDKLRSRFPSLKFESGHDMCHPETCSCWNIRVYDGTKNVHNCDYLNQTVEFCESYVNAKLAKVGE